MSISLRNLFGGPGGRRATRTRVRPSGTTRPHVEALEKRDVPAVMNLTDYVFALPGARLYITHEVVSTGVFDGAFVDLSSGITIPILNGHLQPIGLKLDQMTFQGTGTQGLKAEHVAFQGSLHEAVFPLMSGKLTENYSLPIGRWTVTRQVETYGRPLRIFPLATGPAAPADLPLPGARPGAEFNPSNPDQG
jgi:hypothetical protein